MILTLSLRGGILSFPSVDRGMSDDARTIRGLVSGPEAVTPSISAEDYRRVAVTALKEALSQARELGWDGYAAKPADPSAFAYAVRFLNSLPTAIPFPEIAVDSDGDFALEWDRGPRRVFSARITRDGTIYYAGLEGASTFHGSEPFSEGIPSAISAGIGRVVSEPRL